MDDAPEREQLYNIFNDTYHRLKNTAEKNHWGPETHSALLSELFGLVNRIIPDILREYDGDRDESDKKLIAVAAQFRHSITRIMSWDKFTELITRSEMTRYVNRTDQWYL